MTGEDHVMLDVAAGIQTFLAVVPYSDTAVFV